MTHEHRPAHSRFRLVIFVVLASMLAVATIMRSLLSNDAEPVGEAAAPPVVAPSTEPTSALETTIEDEAAAVARALRGAAGAWTDRTGDIVVRTVLRRPVIEIATNLDAEDAEAVDAFSAQLAADVAEIARADGATYFVRIVAGSGDVVGVLASTDERWAIDGPSPPGDASSLYAWLDDVYGSGSAAPEPWFAEVTGIRDPSTDPEGYLVVATTLDPSAPADLAMAQTVFDAVNSSGATFAPGIRITFGTGAFDWVALMDGAD
ncbi:hypothetical protein EG835_09690, partial [bacterium]|nr:hypothetical protein [bacterium]